MKIYLKFLLSFTLALTIIIGCEKTPQDLKKPVASDFYSNQDLTIEENFVPLETNCTVPTGYTSCNSSCLFSECCVVWDPKKETGGCGCFFGVARCKTEPIETPEKSSNLKGSNGIRNIIFHTKKFEEFLSFCKEKSIEVSNIENSFIRNVIRYMPGEQKSIMIEPSSYDLFINDYEDFIKSLSINQLELVNNYIN